MSHPLPRPDLRRPGPQPHNEIAGELLEQVKRITPRPQAGLSDGPAGWAAERWLAGRRRQSLDAVLARLRLTVARTMVREWTAAGVRVRLDGQRLYAGPREKVTDEMKAAMADYRTELEEVCRGEAEPRVADDGPNRTPAAKAG